MPHEWSKYQQSIFEFVKSGTGNGIVVARAGAAKTTTAVEALSYMTGRVVFLAFNKHIADELALQLKVRGVQAEAMTNHGLGNRTLRRAFGNIRLDDRKYFEILKCRMNAADFDDKVLRAAVLRMADLARLTLTDYRDRAALADLVGKFDIDVNGGLDKALDLVPFLLDEGRRMTTVIDFADMIWLPNILDLPVQSYDWVVVDEGQDLNRAQQELVLKAAAKGRMLVVADPRQAIYSWAGADPSGVDRFTERLKATVFSLPICYRCPTSHLDLAREIVPDIEARPNAPEGEIHRDVPLPEAIKAMSPKDMVLCRVNAPLATIALTLIRDGKKAVIRGRDIGKSLVNLIDKHAPMAARLSLDETLILLGEYRRIECAKLERLGKDVQADSLHDRIETIFALADGVKTVLELRQRVEAIFDDKLDGIVCSSVHRAKGLQADRVFIYRPELMPFPKAKSPDEKLAEENVRYVALTRSKASLWFVKKAD